MRYIRYAFLAALAVVLVTVAVANRTPVELRLLSDTLAGLIGVNATVTLPLFLVIFGGIVAGLPNGKCPSCASMTRRARTMFWRFSRKAGPPGKGLWMCRREPGKPAP